MAAVYWVGGENQDKVSLVMLKDGAILTGGNPTNWYNGTTFTNLTWTQGRRLSSLTKGTGSNTTSINYTYDMSGIRTSKTVGSTTHSYVTQSGKVVRESFGTTVLEFFYDAGGRPFALNHSTDSGSTFTKYYYVLNAQGDVVGLLDSSGTLIVKYTYDAWGKPISIDSSITNTDYSELANANPLRYRGYYYDTETGWYYLQSRYYDPIVKRFLNADALASTATGFLGYNMFAYCNNNPVNMIDFDGGRPYWEHNYGGATAYTDSGSSHPKIPIGESNDVSDNTESGSLEELNGYDGMGVAKPNGVSNYSVAVQKGEYELTEEYIVKLQLEKEFWRHFMTMGVTIFSTPAGIISEICDVITVDSHAISIIPGTYEAFYVTERYERMEGVPKEVFSYTVTRTYIIVYYSTGQKASFLVEYNELAIPGR